MPYEVAATAHPVAVAATVLPAEIAGVLRVPTVSGAFVGFLRMVGRGAVSTLRGPPITPS